MVPVMALLVLWALPLALGTRTLYLRDVLNTHLPMKAAQAAAMHRGEWLPLVDPYRAGGQPLLGNPNAVPLYPDNVLYLFAPVLWALNAHFWLHLLLAPFAMYWLGRAFGLPRTAAWAGGVVYAFCGYTLSNLNFYNLIAGVALTPAFIAAVLRARALASRPMAALAGILWALLLLAGEPLLAGLALLLALGAVYVLRRDDEALSPRRWAPWLGLALACGTLIAAPQLVELWRILPFSLRGWRGYSGDAGSIGSLDPRQIFEWFLPLAFGRPDLLRGSAFWGESFYSGKPPIYFSLYPGVLAWALALASGSPRRRPVALWAWGAVAAGFFFALGASNPLARPLFRLGLLRYPIKFWLLGALGAALLAGVGWARAFSESAESAGSAESADSTESAKPVAEPSSPRQDRRLRSILRGFAVVLGIFWLGLTLAPTASQALLRTIVPASRPDEFVAGERLRWAGVSLVSLGLVMLLLAGLRLTANARFSRLGFAVLLVLHAGGQMFLLQPLLGTDESAPYRVPSPLLAELPLGASVVHGGFADLFGPSNLQEGQYPAPQLRFVERRAFAELYPFAGQFAGRRYELDTSPEGLDAFVTRLAQATVERLPDLERLRLLRAWGVDRLLLSRPLDENAASMVRALATIPAWGSSTTVYAIADPAPKIRFVGNVLPAADANVALQAMLRPDFDARQTAVVAGEGAVELGSGGTVRVLDDSTERIEAEVQADSAGLLVMERAHLSMYRALVDGAQRPTEITNVCRLGVRVPAGTHRVLVELDRRPTHRAAVGSLLGGLGLLALVMARRKERAVRAN